MRGFQREDVWRIGPGVIALLTGVGIVTGLGVTRASSCDLSFSPWILTGLARPPWMTSELNVLLAIGLLALACIAIATPRPIAAMLMGLEFVGFLIFFLLLRGGYTVGYAGVPIPEVVQFDIVSAGCQGGVLAFLALGDNPRRDRRIRMAVVAGALCAFVVVGVKLIWFRHPRW